MNTVQHFTYYTKFIPCVCNQLLECDNALWVRVYNKIICISMGSCTILHWEVVAHLENAT